VLPHPVVPKVAPHPVVRAAVPYQTAFQKDAPDPEVLSTLTSPLVVLPVLDRPAALEAVRRQAAPRAAV